jgi:pyridoxal phosphate enzyme (YggS family)
LDAVRTRIGDAARRAGRDPRAITLIGVVKTVPIPLVLESLRSGLTDVGENRVQDAQDAVERVGRRAARWHMIGHLQRNKAGRALELFDRIHGVDDAALAEALSRRAEAAGRQVPVLVQVNVEGETTKAGVSPEVLDGLVEGVARLPGLALDGLMSIGPPSETAEQARRHFARVRALRDSAERRTGVRLPELSMGMSGDYEVAVEEGSTMVRVGTAIFGARGA